MSACTSRNTVNKSNSPRTVMSITMTVKNTINGSLCVLMLYVPIMVFGLLGVVVSNVIVLNEPFIPKEPGLLAKWTNHDDNNNEINSPILRFSTNFYYLFYQFNRTESIGQFSEIFFVNGKLSHHNECRFSHLFFFFIFCYLKIYCLLFSLLNYFIIRFWKRKLIN